MCTDSYYSYTYEHLLNSTNTSSSGSDPKAASEDRKKDHISLTNQAQHAPHSIDDRFFYEPLRDWPTSERYMDDIFDGRMKFPLWISSMTGGLDLGALINTNLAKGAQKHGLGMGLGSCRAILFSDDRLDDFLVRKHIGSQPLYANLGIAQIQQLYISKNIAAVHDLLQKTEADGLIVHINPLQEFAQPGGDAVVENSIDCIRWLLDSGGIDVIVKEVGQGMGPKSLSQLMALPIRAIDTASSGGTNFSLLELLRSDPIVAESYNPLVHVGHSAEEMIDFINKIQDEKPVEILCPNTIISGGVKSFLDAFYLRSKLRSPSAYGQASSLLKYAMSSYEELDRFIELQIEGYNLAEKLLVPKHSTYAG